MIDSHCHIHSKVFSADPIKAIQDANEAGIEDMVLVGEDIDDSKLAKELAGEHGLMHSIGIHPHHAQKADLEPLVDGAVAIGECGLDYYYMNSPRQDQIDCLKYQIELAKKHNLPLILHMRGSKENPEDIFEDLWPLAKDISGVIHSFTASKKQVLEARKHGLLFGLNGIITFTKDKNLLEAVRAMKLEEILLETDAPFLTPTPYRGKINEPKYLSKIAEAVAEIRGESVETVAETTTINAQKLFGRR